MSGASSVGVVEAPEVAGSRPETALRETFSCLSSIWKPGCLLAMLLFAVLPACRSADVPEASVHVAAVPATEPIDNGALDAQRLAAALGGARVTADTSVVLERAGRPVMLRDERRLAQAENGDFELSVRRIHAGSEAGDTDEQLGAVRVGVGYWTRGSAGPWVAWDDAVDEPAQAAATALAATKDFLSLVRQCGRVESGTDVQVVALGSQGCEVQAAPDGAGWTGRVLAMSGTLSWKTDVLVGMDMRVRLLMAAGGGGGEVTLEHSFSAQALEPAGIPTAPEAKQTVPSRRDRPARMVRTVFQGWEDALGPGAPAPAKNRRQ